MRKVPILTVLSLAAVCGLMVAPVHAGTLYGNDTPDVVLAPGASGANVLDLSDFFSSSASASLTYSAAGAGSVSGSMASVNGGATAGAADVTFSADDGNGAVALNPSTVQISEFLIGNGPAIDNNNRLAGMAGGNPFLVPLMGNDVSSVEALSGLPSGGGGGSPSGGTGAAAIMATVGQVSLNTAPTGLRQRSSTKIGDGSGAGVSVSLDASGNYTISGMPTGPVVVTLGAMSGASADAVHLVAAPATAVDLSSAAGLTVIPAGTFPQATINFDGSAVISAQASEGVLVVGGAVPSSGLVTVSLDYQTDSTAVAIAAIGFDGVLDFPAANYANLSGANLEAGATKNLVVSFNSMSGSVLPAFQVFNAGTTAANVTISNVMVIQAGPVTDYALNPNATVDLPASANDVAGWQADILGAGAGGPTASTENNFEAPAGGSLSLAGVGGVANAAIQVPLNAGTVAAECYVMRSGAADAGSAFFLVIESGAGTTVVSTMPGASVPETWTKATASSAQMGGTVFLVVQAAGVNVMVDDVVIRMVDDMDSYADLGLL
jgi:hypothetical protein